MTDSFYKYHVFFCVNQREGSTRECCANKNAKTAQEHAKTRIKGLGLAQPGLVRINQAGCMERCEQGPVLVVYPEGIWYHYLDTEDIDEIIDQHLVLGQPVARLRISATPAAR